MSDTCHPHLPGLSTPSGGAARRRSRSTGRYGGMLGSPQQCARRICSSPRSRPAPTDPRRDLSCHAVNQTSTADMVALPIRRRNATAQALHRSLRTMADARGVVLDTLPRGLTLRPAAHRGGVCGRSGNHRLVSFRSLARGGSRRSPSPRRARPGRRRPTWRHRVWGGRRQRHRRYGERRIGCRRATFTNTLMVTSDTFIEPVRQRADVRGVDRRPRRPAARRQPCRGASRPTVAAGWGAHRARVTVWDNVDAPGALPALSVAGSPPRMRVLAPMPFVCAPIGAGGSRRLRRHHQLCGSRRQRRDSNFVPVVPGGKAGRRER